MEKQQIQTMADVLISNRTRKIKNQFFSQVDTLIDWQPILKIINKFYKKTSSATGRPAYNGLVLFKICLLQTWYGLSDYEVEDRLNDSLSFSKFVGLPSEESSPDHSTISRFRSLMSKHKAYDTLLKEINNQLEKHQIIVKKGVLVDASVVETPHRPKSKPGYEIVEDRQDEAPSQENQEKEQKEKKYQKVHQPGVDTEGGWLKKGKKAMYGFKKHVVTDQEGMVLGVVTTAANVNEISNLKEVLDNVELEAQTAVFADKGYQSEKNQEVLSKKRLKSRILHKSKRNKKISEREVNFNKACSKIRYKVERTFGSIKRWFNGGRARYRGQEKVHGQNVLESLAYNLYRSPGIVIANSTKM